MSNHLQMDPSLVNISIPEAVNDDNVTYYVISVKVDAVEWTVRHRYKDFVELHEHLTEAGVDKDSLPPKKIIGNRDAGFIRQRRQDLEKYLRNIFKFLERSTPMSLLEFLHFTRYDINYVLRELASQHEVFSDIPPEEDVPDVPDVKWTPLEMYAVSDRLKSPLPPSDIGDQKYDFVNVADHCCNLTELNVEGKDEKLGNSNIVINQLEFDFFAFESLTKLILTKINIKMINTFGHSLRKSLKHLQINNSDIVAVKDVLLRDFSEAEEENKVLWPNLEYLDLRNNHINMIDKSTTSAPHLTTLRLSRNQITEIENLTHLPGLNILDLSHNNISKCPDLHLKMGQITRINLSNNKLKNLHGFWKLYSLNCLNLSGNIIRELESVVPVCGLPCLEVLNLQGNKVTTVVDYRLKVFEAFGKRCSEVTLDNEAASQSEVDRVSVLMALRVAREGKSPTSLFGNLPRRV